MRTTLLLLAPLLLLACSDPTRGGDSNDDNDADAGQESDVGSDTDDVEETPTDDHPCVGAVDTRAIFEPHAGGPLTRIHAALAVAPDAIWLTYNVPAGDGTGFFDVWATSFGCDGQAVVAPFKVNSTTGRNQVDPAIALSGDRLLIAWAGDDQMSVHNLQTFMRPLHLDGRPALPADVQLETTWQGAPIEATLFMNQLAPLAGGEFVVVGARGSDAAPTFQVFAQRLSADGDRLGETLDVAFDPTVGQTSPAVAADGAGRIYVGWDESKEDSDTLHHTTATLQGERLEAEPAQPVVDAPAGTASYAVGTDGQIYLAYTGFVSGDQQVVLRDGDLVGPTARLVALGEGGEVDHSPTVAAGTGGGAVAWFENISGFRNNVFVQSFQRGADGRYELGSVRRIATELPAPPYALAFVHVAQDLYVLAWSEGNSPDFVIRAQFFVLH